MKVLLSAYACEPGKGSEPGIGWNWVKQISRYQDCWVISRANNRPAIERAILAEKIENVHVTYFDLPRWARFWKKGQRGTRLYYYLWQIGAYRLARRLHKQIKFDLVHHLTFGTYWMPSLLSFIPAPFLWGPVGGGESAPQSFRFSYSLRGIVYEFARNMGRRLGECDPLVRMTARRAAACLATTSQTAERLRRIGCRNVSLMSHAALSAEELDQLSQVPSRDGSPFRIISVGRLLHWKGFDFGLRAFAEFHRAFPESEYWIIGDGPEAKRLQNLATALGIGAHTTFWGGLDRAEALKKIAASDVLVHPSLHDSSGWVAVEAMASGRPVICLDLGGPALQVTDTTGIKVRADSPAKVVPALAAAMADLASDKVHRFALGSAARARAHQEFNWVRKGDEIKKLYAELIETSKSTEWVINQQTPYCEAHDGK